MLKSSLHQKLCIPKYARFKSDCCSAPVRREVNSTLLCLRKCEEKCNAKFSLAQSIPLNIVAGPSTALLQDYIHLNNGCNEIALPKEKCNSIASRLFQKCSIADSILPDTCFEEEKSQSESLTPSSSPKPCIETLVSHEEKPPSESELSSAINYFLNGHEMKAALKARSRHENALTLLREGEISKAGNLIFLSAVGGHTSAQYNLALGLQTGLWSIDQLGMKQPMRQHDLPSTVEFIYKEAATKGHPQALYNLGVIQIKKSSPQRGRKDMHIEKARLFFEESASLGFRKATKALQQLQLLSKDHQKNDKFIRRESADSGTGTTDE